MNAMSALTSNMFTALREMPEGVFTSADVTVHPNVLKALCDQGFLTAERDGRPTLYAPTPMGHGAIAALRGPVFPHDATGAVARIQQTVANYFSIPLIDMTSSRRQKAIARPRQIAMYLCRQLTRHSYPSIGKKFGDRDHTTVIHAVQTIERLKASDSTMARDVETLSAKLGGVA